MTDNNSSHDLFISYSRKNKDVVLPIKGEIERRLGLKCWIDLSNIPCGSENFKQKVIPGIKQTRVAFLFFLSAESQASEYAMKEINFAKKRAGKRVILIRFNDDEMTDEFAFDYQDADIIDWREEEQKQKFLHDISAWAGQGTPQKTVTPAFCGARAYGKAPSQNAVSPQFPPRYKAREYDRGFSHFLEKHKDLLIGLLVILLVIVFVGIPVYVITSRLMAQ